MNSKIGNFSMKGETKVENNDDTIKYGAGSEKNPMDEFVSEEEVEPDTTSIEIDDVNIPEEPMDGNLDKSKIREYGEDTPSLSESERPGFNPQSTQDARKDSRVEGGVTRTETSGSMKNFKSATSEGKMLRFKPRPDMTADSISGKYEVTGFEASYEVTPGNVDTIPIRDYFDDIETAKASVSPGRYLIPMPGGGFRISKIIKGSPQICINDVAKLQYVDGRWVRP